MVLASIFGVTQKKTNKKMDRREEAKIVKKQNVNKDKPERELFGGTGLRIDGSVHDKTRLQHSKDCSKKLRDQRDKKHALEGFTDQK